MKIVPYVRSLGPKFRMAREKRRALSAGRGFLEILQVGHNRVSAGDNTQTGRIGCHIPRLAVTWVSRQSSWI